MMTAASLGPGGGATCPPVPSQPASAAVIAKAADNAHAVFETDLILILQFHEPDQQKPAMVQIEHQVGGAGLIPLSRDRKLVEERRDRRLGDPAQAAQRHLVVRMIE